VRQHLRDRDSVVLNGPTLPAFGDPRQQRRPDRYAQAQREKRHDCRQQ
jgi:hypothetical protein